MIEAVWRSGLNRRETAHRLGISERALRYHEKQAFDRMRQNAAPTTGGLDADAGG